MTDFAAILANVTDHAMSTGYFETVNFHEPKNAPGNGLNLAAWIDYIGPFLSGLKSTSGLLVINCRVYSSMFQQPYDAIDPNLLDAVQNLIGAYTGNFGWTADVRNLDVLGQSGRKLEAQAGYIPIDNKMMRAMTITVPLIINDIWSQTA